jgi:hypothetical protein
MVARFSVVYLAEQQGPQWARVWVVVTVLFWGQPSVAERVRRSAVRVRRLQIVAVNITGVIVASVVAKGIVMAVSIGGIVVTGIVKIAGIAVRAVTGAIMVIGAID